MPALGLNHFNLQATQPMLDTLRDFYVDVVGLKAGWRPPFPFPGYWLYLGDSPVLHLVELAPPGPDPQRQAGTFDHVAFTCTGAAEFERRLQRLGVACRSAAVPGTTQYQLFIQDPSGNGVELNFASREG